MNPIISSAFVIRRNGIVHEVLRLFRLLIDKIMADGGTDEFPTMDSVTEFRRDNTTNIFTEAILRSISKKFTMLQLHFYFNVRMNNNHDPHTQEAIDILQARFNRVRRNLIQDDASAIKSTVGARA